MADRLRAVPGWALARRDRRPLVRVAGLARPRDARPVHHGRRAHLLGAGEELRLRPRLRRPRRPGAGLRRRLPDPDLARVRDLRPDSGRLRDGQDDQQPGRCRSPPCPRISSPGGSSASGSALLAARARRRRPVDGLHGDRDDRERVLPALPPRSARARRAARAPVAGQPRALLRGARPRVPDPRRRRSWWPLRP